MCVYLALKLEIKAHFGNQNRLIYQCEVHLNWYLLKLKTHSNNESLLLLIVTCNANTCVKRRLDEGENGVVWFEYQSALYGDSDWLHSMFFEWLDCECLPYLCRLVCYMLSRLILYVCKYVNNWGQTVCSHTWIMWNLQSRVPPGTQSSLMSSWFHWCFCRALSLCKPL